MPKDFSRGLRVADQIQRELAELLRSEVKDPRVGLVTLTSVEVSPDYAHAKVYYTSLAAGADLAGVEAGLRRASGFLRRELAHRIRIHHVPELHFVFDASVERGMHLSQLIDQAVRDSGSTDA